MKSIKMKIYEGGFLRLFTKLVFLELFFIYGMATPYPRENRSDQNGKVLL